MTAVERRARARSGWSSAGRSSARTCAAPWRCWMSWTRRHPGVTR